MRSKVTSGMQALAMGLAMAAVGCSDADDGASGAGALRVRASGEAAAVDGFPFTEDGETVALADGWSVQFSKVLVAFGNLSVKGKDGASGVTSTDTYVVDLHQQEMNDVVLLEELPARRWDAFSFEIVPPTAATRVVGGVAAADVSAMVAGGYNYWLEGTASLGAREVSFRWGLRNPTRNADCTNGEDDTAGIVVPNNSEAEAILTFHLDHLMWTSLGTEEAELRFEAIAAADALGDGDGVVTWEELALQQLADLKDGAGAPLGVVYNPGSVSPTPTNLQEFLLKSSASMGHLNGEGLCTVSAK